MHLPSGEESSDDGRFDDDGENSNSEMGAEESNTEQSLEFPDDLSPPTCDLQESDLDGDWNRGTICGRTLTWNEGEVVALTIISGRTLQLTYLGTTYTGELREDCRLHWDDGDIWTRPHLKSTAVVPSGCHRVCAARPSGQQELEEDVQRLGAPSSPTAPQVPGIDGELAARVAAMNEHRRIDRDVAMESISSREALVAAKAVKAQPAAVPVSQKRYEGIVKYFRGAFGWVVCEELSAVYRGFDVFLHKRECDVVPRQSDKVRFRLCLDDLGNPKGVDARLVKAPDMVSARDWFSRGR